MESYRKELDKIKKLLQENPKGLTISEVSDKIGVNRNSVAKYLAVMTIAGTVEKKEVGPAKLFFQSNRFPISAFLDLGSDAVVLLDSNLKVVRVNERFGNLMKSKKEVFLGQGIDEEPLKDLFSPLKQDLEESLNGKENNKTIILNKEDKQFHFHMKMAPSTFEDGTPGVTIILEDLTEIKKAQKEIESLAKFPSENPNPVLRIHKSGEVLYSNTPGEDFLIKWKSAVGKKVPEFVEKFVLESLDSGKIFKTTIENRGKEYLVSIVPIKKEEYVNIYGFRLK